MKALATLAALLALTFAGARPALAEARAPDTEARIAAIVGDVRLPVGAPGRPDAPVSLADAMAAHHVHALSIAVVDGGRIVWARAYGEADVASGRKATPDTLFQAASISKPVSATAILQLVQEGKLSLDEDVNAKLKSWKAPPSPAAAGKPLTLRELLTHTGGTTVHGFAGYEAGAPVPSVVQVLNGAPPANSPAVVVEHEPGTVWNYSGGGITIAQLLATDVTGEAFPKLMQDRVLAPAQMAASSFVQPLPQSRRDVAAVGYRKDGTELPGRYHTYPELAAAGLWTTPSDLARWVIGIQEAYAGKSKRLLSQAMAKAMLTPGLGDWGLGVRVKGSGETMTFQHTGGNEGFQCDLVGFVQGGRGVVVMTNSDDGYPVANALAHAVAREYGWQGL